MLVLVRLLPPEVYGQFGFITAVLGFLTLVSFREFLGYTLVVRAPEQIHYQDHFTAGAVIQAGVFLLANLIGLLLRWFPAYADVAPVIHVMSVLFLLDLPSELRVKMLERQLDWRHLRLLHGLALVASGLLSVVMALSGLGVYALVLPTLVVPIVFAWDLWARAGWRPTWHWNWEDYRAASQFGTTRIAASSLGMGSGLIESTWLTTAVGFASFGLFGRAVALAQLLCGRLARLVGMAVFPVAARIEPRSPRYRQASAVWLRSVTWVVVPAAIVGAQAAGPLVRVLYGQTWIESANLLPMAVAVAAVGSAGHTVYLLLLLHERSRWCLRADVWRLAGTIVALAVLAPMGLSTYLAGLAAVHAVALVAMSFWLQRDDGITVKGLWDAYVPPTMAGATAAVVGHFSGQIGGGADDWVVLSLRVLSVSVIYVLVLRIVFRSALAELVAYMPERQRLSNVLRLKTDP